MDVSRHDSGLDLALVMVEKDLGLDVARSVAHRLVMPQRRSGGQTQMLKCLSWRQRRTAFKTR
ncbi:hypothetical protein BURKHO8Y_510041 [Burkholderia sp. 8Y]|nr:hypothetical protein BURKHO8Y_510041 [Burkholderia sp. 8Y]